MNLLNKMILETLSPLGVPVGFQKYSGQALTYITFHEYLQTGEEFEDDGEAFTGHYIQVDVWSKSDYSTLVAGIKQALKNAGFNRLDEADLYEPDTALYHKGIKFYYLEPKEV